MLGISLSSRPLGRLLGQGAYRSTYSIGGRYVRKEQQYMSDMPSGNGNEIILWTAVRDTPDAKYFAPIVEHDPDGEWVIQPRCTILARSRRKPRQATVQRVTRAARKWGVYDIKSDNMGFLPNGRLVITDYGNLSAYDADAEVRDRLTESESRYSWPSGGANDSDSEECDCLSCREERGEISSLPEFSESPLLELPLSESAPVQCGITNCIFCAPKQKITPNITRSGQRAAGQRELPFVEV